MDQIDRELESARHYFRLVEKHEEEFRAAEESGSVDAKALALRDFVRELGSFLNAGRTVRNYLIRATDASGQRSWLNERLAPPTFEFHGKLLGSVVHEAAVVPSRNVGVSIRPLRPGEQAQIEVVHTEDGSIDLEPRSSNVEKVPLRLIYSRDDLGVDLCLLLDKVTSEVVSIVTLGGEYVYGLEQVLKNARRNGRI